MQKRLTQWIAPTVITVALLPILFILGSAGATILGFINQFDFLEVSGIMADVSLFTFTAMLACTPLNILFGWRWPLTLRRPLGLLAFMYSAVHYLVFMAGFQFNVGAGLAATAASNMLLFGFLGVLLMVPLALTSNRWSMNKLGQNWKRLHYLVYAIAIFIILHMLLLGQGALTVPTYLLLLGVRIPRVRQAIVRWRQSWRQGQSDKKGQSNKKDRSDKKGQPSQQKQPQLTTAPSTQTALEGGAI